MSLLERTYKNLLATGFFLILCSNIAYTQCFDSLEQHEIFSKNMKLLRYRAVLFNNGDRPYSENGLWGLKGENGEIRLVAQYDSILFGGPNHCIVLRNGTYNVLDSLYRECFKKPMDKIRADDFGIYARVKATDKEELYQVYATHIVSAKSEYNLVWFPKKPKEFPQPVLQNQLVDYIDGEVVDSMYSHKDGDVILYLKNGEQRVIPGKSWRGLLGERYMRIENGSKERVNIVEILTGDTVFRGDNFSYVHYLDWNGEGFFFFNDRESESTTIRRRTGEVVLQTDKQLTFQQGLLLERIGIEKSKVLFNFYSFPDLRLLERSIVFERGLGNFVLVKNVSTEHYSLYSYGLKIAEYRLKKGEQIGMEVFNLNDTLVQIIRADLKGRTNFTAYNRNGEILLSTGFDKTEKSVFSNHFNQIFYRQEVEGYEFVDNTFIYNRESKTFQLLIADLSNQIDTNVFIYRGAVLDYLCDMNGNCLLDTEYDDIDVDYRDYELLIQLRKEDVYSIRYRNLDVLCDSCCFSPIPHYNNQYELPPHYLIYKGSHSNGFLYDRSGKQLLEDAFLCMIYFKGSNSLIGLNKERKLIYIPINSLQK